MRAASDAGTAFCTDDRTDLEATINATECDVVVTGTPIDLGRLVDSKHPIRHVRYELEEVGAPSLADVLEPILAEKRALVAGR